MNAPTHDSAHAQVTRFCHPHTSWCLRCGMSWAAVDEHTTPYGPNVVASYRALDADIRRMIDTGQVGLFGCGCFPLCDRCWAKLTVEEREPYYWSLLREWDTPDHPLSEEIAHQVIAACREGL